MRKQMHFNCKHYCAHILDEQTAQNIVMVSCYVQSALDNMDHHSTPNNKLKLLTRVKCTLSVQGIFYCWPQHHSCHETPQWMQTFNALKLPHLMEFYTGTS